MKDTFWANFRVISLAKVDYLCDERLTDHNVNRLQIQMDDVIVNQVSNSVNHIYHNVNLTPK
jgi:hypothetical protein